MDCHERILVTNFPLSVLIASATSNTSLSLRHELQVFNLWFQICPITYRSSLCSVDLLYLVGQRLTSLRMAGFLPWFTKGAATHP